MKFHNGLTLLGLVLISFQSWGAPPPETTGPKQQAWMLPGKTISKKVSGETGVSYHLYFPKNFSGNHKHPILFAFSPGGNGVGILNKVKAGTEKAGWIVVGCDSLRNNFKNRELAIQMENDILDEVLSTIPHHPQRIYLGGFSGGAWRAYHISARRKEKFAGILAFGGWLGGTNSQNEPYRENMSVAMINGIDDRGANAWMPIDTKSLNKRNCSVKHFAFEGGHGVAPWKVTQSAVDWLEEDWERKNKGAQSEKIPLRVCYVGAEGQRAIDFKTYLSERFQEAYTVQTNGLNLELCNRADVLLLDTVVRNLPNAYTKASLLVGKQSWITAERYGSKVDQAFLGMDSSGMKAYRDTELIELYGEEGSKPVPMIREAHRLFWNCAASPAQMAPSQKNVLAKAIILIHTYDGYQQSDFANLHPRNAIKGVLNSSSATAEELMRWFPHELLLETQFEKENLKAYFQNRLPYVFIPHGSGLFEMDTIAEKLQTPNNDVASLKKWIEMLRTDQRKTAMGLLLQYTGQRIRKPADWELWFEQNKNHLHFSDDNGYRFFVEANP